MSLQVKYEDPEDGQIVILQQTLQKMHNAPDSFSTWDALEPVQFLNKIELPAELKSEIQRNFSYWPKELQEYFKKEVLESIKIQAEYNQEDLKILYRYLKTAFIALPDCTVVTFPDGQLDRAMKSVSKELDQYYGREENDENIPCWP